MEKEEFAIPSTCLLHHICNMKTGVAMKQNLQLNFLYPPFPQKIFFFKWVNHEFQQFIIMKFLENNTKERRPFSQINMVGLGLWHINHCRLFNAKSSLYIYIKYIWFGWVGFYGISTIVGYLMPNPLYTYIFNIYDLVGLGFMAYQRL